MNVGELPKGNDASVKLACVNCPMVMIL